MSISSSMNAGVAGLSAQASALAAVSDTAQITLSNVTFIRDK